jgi:hypothetical protein
VAGQLQSQLQIRALSDGFDPTIGVMHFQRTGSPAFIFDLMEPERPKIDRTIIEFLKSEKLHPVDFTIRRDGVVRLNPQLAKRVAGFVATQIKAIKSDRLNKPPSDSTIGGVLRSDLSGAAVHVKLAPSYEAAVVRSKKEGRARNFVRLSEPPQRGR